MTTGRFEPDKLLDFFRHFDEKNSFHVDAIKLLQEECEALDPDLMSDFTPWVRMYRSKGTQGVALKFTPRLFSNLTGYPEKRFSQEFCHDCAYLFERTGFSDHRDCSRMLMANLLCESGGFRCLQDCSQEHGNRGVDSAGWKYGRDEQQQDDRHRNYWKRTRIVVW